MIKAIVFDMDGVLVDAKDWHYEALNRALKLFGIFIKRYDHLITYDGLPTRQKLELLSREQGLPRGLHGFLSQLKQIYTMELVHTRCKPVFCHEYALARLAALGFKLAVASNSVRQTVDLVMLRNNLAKYMDLMLSNEDVSKAKPDPEIYLSAASRLKIEPSACLVVEDNENGIRAAEAAGAHLLKVDGVHDVNFENIFRRIAEIESGRL